MPNCRTLSLAVFFAWCMAGLYLPSMADAPVRQAVTLDPLDVHPRTSLTIVEQLRHNHYLRKTLDDKTSSKIFDNYLELLDSSRAYFTASDITEFEQYRYKLDDALKRGDLEPAFHIFNRHQERLMERFRYLLAQLSQGLEQFDFTLDEHIEVDRQEASWPADRKAMDQFWHKRLKSAVLNMKLNGKPDEEIQQLLTKRYNNRLKQVQQTTSEDAFGLYVNALTEAYDPHTKYFSPRISQNFNINMSLSLQGIGAVLSSDDDYTSVVRLVPAGPAAKSGKIKPSDRIISVGQGWHGPLIDVVGWRLDDVVELIRGPKGSVVRLETVPGEGEEQVAKVIEITRNTVKLEEQAAQKKLLTLNRNGKDYRIGVIEVPTFYVDFKALKEGARSYRSSTSDVERLIQELNDEGVDGLVMDLRNNGGGSLQEADKLTGLFIKSGPTVQVRPARRRPDVYVDTNESLAWSGPLAIMVNRLSASASEIFAGAIQDYERGVVVGSRTFGKGTVQTLVPLNRGQLKITAAKFYRVSGQSTQHRGILPDIEFPEIYDTERIGESSSEDAMVWDRIEPVTYARANNVQVALPYLRSRHEHRVKDDPDFAYLRKLTERIQQNSATEYVSLNEGVRRREKAEEDAWRLDLENALRLANGEAAVSSLEELQKEASPVGEEKELDPAEDPLLVETGEVLVDWIGFNHQLAMVEQPEPGPPSDRDTQPRQASAAP